MRAEQEYRALIQEYPDSKLVPQAKARLREVQEVLAEREFQIGRFYYLRQAYPAAIARLETMIDRYPLYSGADEALYLMGQSYESEIELLRRNPKLKEANKSRMIEELTKGAAEAYDRIIKRYPAEDRAVDAKARLEALHQPVPRPTRAAMELNKKEVAGRQEPSVISGMMRNFEKHPDVDRATKLGDPTLVDPAPVTPQDVVKAAANSMNGTPSAADNKVTVETMTGSPAPNEEAPRSDTTPTTRADQPTAGSETPAASSAETNPPATSDSTANTAGELKSNVADPNELKPNVPADPNALPPPQQTNQISAGESSSSSSASKSGGNSDELVDISSSKKKKKKGLSKLNPF
jgi:outer membrane protein assembly factor BamD